MTYFEKYCGELQDTLLGINPKSIELLKLHLLAAFKSNKPILVFGNGGSAAVADHFACDMMKGIAVDTNLIPNVQSLGTNSALITAIANDYNYNEIFSKQIEWRYDNPLLIAMSVSGNSLNVLNALRTGRDKFFTQIAMVGMDGGAIKTEDNAYPLIHIPSNNYGITEDCFSIIMHAVSQDSRLELTKKKGIKL
jgi:phosphoheptose isomerase